jgi:hypothetical protein
MEEQDRRGPADVALEHVAAGVDLAGYAGGGLAAAEQRSVEDHLQACAACDSAVTDLRVLVVLLDLATGRG